MRDPVPYVTRAIQDFLTGPLSVRVAMRKPEETAQRALMLFQAAFRNVPAYRTFLAQSGVAAGNVSTLADFKRLPMVTKENYIQVYPLPSLCRNGKIEECDMIAVSSGSTGEPTYWPRFLNDELAVAYRFEQVFYDSFSADVRNTLAVVCFPLGTWVGGMYTAACCRHLATKGYPITTITPGNNVNEILRVVRDLGGHFDQVVLLGYPPFVKGVIDTGLAQKLDWKQFNVRLVLAGEVFSEEWRTLVCERLGTTDIYRSSASIYGTADAGVLANETPLSVCIRRWFSENPKDAAKFFGESRLPTLAQYDPMSRYFEVEDGNLLFTGDNGIPLVRYNILDKGGLVTFDAMMQYLRIHGFDPITKLGRNTRGVRNLPFVYVFGRSNFTVSYYGANIYPENIMTGIEQPQFKDSITGKFVMEVQTDSDENRRLMIHIELASGIEANDTMRDALAESIREQLLRLNSEFANYAPGEARQVLVSLWEFGSPTYFPTGVKHRYTRKPA